MSDVRCPSCGDVFRVPDFALPAGAVAGCPWCKGRFPIADLRSGLPPLAELLDAEGAALSVQLLPQTTAGFARTAAEPALPQVAPSADNAAFAPLDRQSAGPQPVAADDRPAPLEIVPPALGHATAASWEADDDELEEDDEEEEDSQRNDFETPSEPFGLGFGVAQEPRPLQQVAAFAFADEVHGAPRPRGRKPASPVRSLISIALGGLLALPLAGILLALIGKPLDLGFWPFLGKRNAHPIAIRAGEAADLDERPRTSTGFTKPAGRSLGEDLVPQFQPNNGGEQPSASDRPTVASGTGSEEPPAQDSLSPGQTTPTSPPNSFSEPTATPPGEPDLPLESDSVDAQQARERAAEIAAMPPESNLFHDDHEVLIIEPQTETVAPQAATGKTLSEPQTEARVSQAIANPAPAPVAPVTEVSAIARTNGGEPSNNPTLSAPSNGRDLADASGSRSQVAPKPSETAKAEPRMDAAPRVAAAPDRSLGDQVGDVPPLTAPSITPAPASQAPAQAPASPAPTPQVPAALAAKAPEPLTLPAVAGTRAEPKEPGSARPQAELPSQPRPLSQAMRTELANIETAIQTLVNHREADGTNVLKRRWADLYLAMARAGEVAAPQDQAELAKLTRQMSDSDLIGPLSMMAANWMRISSRPSDGVLVVGPVEKKDGKTFIRWRGTVPLEIRGLPPAIESATGPVLILGRILSSEASAPVIEATFAEAEAR